MSILEQILDAHPDLEFTVYPEYEDCIIGIDNLTNKLIYSEKKILDNLVEKQNMDREEAIEFFEFNILGGRFESQPIICLDAWNE
jgi:hypothetical protein